MIYLAAFLAELDDQYFKQKAIDAASQRSTHESTFLFGVLLTLSVGLFIWAYVSYRKRRRRLARRLHSTPLSQTNAGNATGASQGGRRRRKRYRRRREHRPRNPTLAETGGLPPIRSEDQPPPPV